MMNRNHERGQTLVMVLLALALGALLLGAYLAYVSASHRSGQDAQKAIGQRYAADAGVEDALWRLMNEPGYAERVAQDPDVYTIVLNGETVVITVTSALNP